MALVCIGNIGHINIRPKMFIDKFIRISQVLNLMAMNYSYFILKIKKLKFTLSFSMGHKLVSSAQKYLDIYYGKEIYWQVNKQRPLCNEGEP